MIDLEKARRVATEAVTRAGELALKHWKAAGMQARDVETKPDRSPVTAADKEAEATIRALLREEFPDHDFIGEETGALDRGAQYAWVVDPIDGTRGFTRGGKFWGGLVGLVSEGRSLAGAMALPALGDVYAAARGLGATKNGAPLRVSNVALWADATLSMGEMQHLFRRPDHAALMALVTTAASSRCYGDLAGCAMVLEGRAEAWIEGGVKIWDLAPLQILIEEAGGTFTDFGGVPTIGSGEAVATNGRVHAHVLSVLRGQ